MSRQMRSALSHLNASGRNAKRIANPPYIPQGIELAPVLKALALLAIALWLTVPRPVAAHVGAPYPVLLEEPLGDYIASALADPDVGMGTFYVLVTQADGSAPPPETLVTIIVSPEDGHQPEVRYGAERQQTRYGERFVAKVPFDAKGTWLVYLTIEGPAGTGVTSFPVNVTPSGIGWLGTVACLVPFAVLGGLWLRGSLRQREA